MNIKNFKNLSITSLRRKALEIAEAGYKAIEIEKVIKERIVLSGETLKISHTHFTNSEIELNLSEFKRIFIIGIGKRSALASMALAGILGGRLSGGIVLDVKTPSFFQKIKFCKIRFFKGDHPLPSSSNIKATKKIIKLAENLDEKDLVIAFICGGGSALACSSEKELEESKTIINELTKKGVDISELNTIRKHLSEFKGGGLAKMACPATFVSLIVSDVCGNDLSNVASGPTVMDKTTKKDAERILKKYQLPIADYQLYETSKEEKYFEKVKNILFVCNQNAITEMAKKSQELGFSSKIFNLALEGEARESLLPMIEGVKNNEVLLAAGETTVTMREMFGVRSNFGKGGRNMEAVLGAIVKCQMSNVKCRDLAIISFASDAWDNSDAAGAIGDYSTIEKAKKLKLNPQEFLENHNSYNFFKKTKDLIFAKRKCFNVADLMIILKKN